VARAAALGLVVLGLLPAGAGAANERPATVPALREWAGGTGTMPVRGGARVVVLRNRNRLRPEARQLAEDLRQATRRRWRTSARRRRRVRPGDVVLALGSRDGALGAEGYSLRIGRTVKITARTTAGVFYGGRTLLELLRTSGRLPVGRARDWPRYPERGLMLDNGRQFFTPAWLEKRIRELAGLKLNLLHLHLSDDQGFRIESSSHPEIVSSPHLSKADVRHLVEVAGRQHLTIVPEIDSPGHMTAALAKHPELQLRNAAGQPQPDKLDVTLDSARRFMGDLLDEYLPLFPGRWWHMGSDEYLGIASTEADYQAVYPQLSAYARARYGPNANGKDAVLDFDNWVGERVRRAGKELRVWSDGIEGGSAVKLDPRTAVEWWENRASAPPSELVARGHRVLNSGWWPLYYVTGGTFAALRAKLDEMYEGWEPRRFEGPYSSRWFGGPLAPDPFYLAADEQRQLGASLDVWNDVPGAMSEDQIADGIRPRLRVLAQKTWGSPQLSASYSEFARRVDPVSPAP
jgi:hexosaminidase